MYPPVSTPPHAEASLGSKEFNPKIPNGSEGFHTGPLNGKHCSRSVGYRGESDLATLGTLPSTIKF
jgi:hypothetical protein